MSEPQDVDFKDEFEGPSSETFLEFYHPETREYKGRTITIWVPKDRVNFDTLDDEGYPYEACEADETQAYKDTYEDDDDVIDEGLL